MPSFLMNAMGYGDDEARKRRMLDNERADLFDLPSAMMLQADPGSEFGGPRTGRTAVQAQPDPMAGGPISLPPMFRQMFVNPKPMQGLTPQKPLPVAPPLLTDEDVRRAQGTPLIDPVQERRADEAIKAAVQARSVREALEAGGGYKDAPAGFTGPEGPVKRTFSGPSGVTTYNMTPGFGAYFGSGDVNGQQFGSFDDVGAARGRAALAQGQNETGVAGVPDVRSLEQSLFGGTMIPPDQRRMLAVQSQQRLMQNATEINREKMRGEYDVAKAEAVRREAIPAKILDRAAANGELAFRSTNSEAARQKAYNDTLRRESIGLPEAVRKELGVDSLPKEVPESADNLQKMVKDARKYDRNTVTQIMGEYVNAPEAERPSMLAKMLDAGRHPSGMGDINDFRKMVGLTAAQDYLAANPTALRIAIQAAAKSGEKYGLINPEGLPLNIRVGTGDGILGDSRMYAVMPDGTSIQIPSHTIQRNRFGGEEGNWQQTLARKRVKIAAPDLLKTLYLKEIEKAENRRTQP